MREALKDGNNQSIEIKQPEYLAVQRYLEMAPSGFISFIGDGDMGSRTGQGGHSGGGHSLKKR